MDPDEFEPESVESGVDIEDDELRVEEVIVVEEERVVEELRVEELDRVDYSPLLSNHIFWVWGKGTYTRTAAHGRGIVVYPCEARDMMNSI